MQLSLCFLAECSGQFIQQPATRLEPRLTGAVGWLGTKAILKSGANYCQDLFALPDPIFLSAAMIRPFFSVYVKRLPALLLSC